MSPECMSQQCWCLADWLQDIITILSGLPTSPPQPCLNLSLQNKSFPHSPNRVSGPLFCSHQAGDGHSEDQEDGGRAKGDSQSWSGGH